MSEYLSQAAIRQYADDHPDLDPAAIGHAMAAEMTQVQLAEFAAGYVAELVDAHRRVQARAAEDRAARTPIQELLASPGRLVRTWPASDPEADRAAMAEFEARQARLAAERAASEEQARARISGEEFFGDLLESPVTALAELDQLQTAHWPLPVGVCGQMFRNWCGDRFDSWIRRAEQELEDLKGQQRAEDWQNRQASTWCDRHSKYECSQDNAAGKRCHFASTSDGRCKRHGGSTEQRPDPVNLEYLLWNTFYPGGGVARIINRALEDQAARTRLEVTAELLGTSFALGDGTKVTWGEATADQHRQRVAMLAANARGVVETAARHLAAIRMVEEAGVACLAALPEVVSAA